MAFLNIFGAETGDLSEVGTTGGTVAASTVVKRTGSYSYKVNASSYFYAKTHASDGTKTDFANASLYITFYLYINTLPSALAPIASFENTARGTLVQARLNTSGGVGLWYYNGSNVLTQIGSNSANLSTATWYRIDLKATALATGGSSTAELQVDGSSIASGTSLTVTSAPANAQQISFSSAATGVLYYDDIAISDSAYPGAGQVNILKPNADGTYTPTEWTNGTANSYTEVDEVPHDSDTTYLRTTNPAGYPNAQFNLESCATGGVSGTIAVVKAVAIVRDEGGAATLKIGLDHSGSRASTTAVDPGATYVPLSVLSATDPSTAAAWTSSGLDATELFVQDWDAAGGPPLRATALYAMVWCTGASAAKAFRRTLLGVGV